MLDELIIGITCKDKGTGVFLLGAIYLDKQHENLGIGTKTIEFIIMPNNNYKKETDKL